MQDSAHYRRQLETVCNNASLALFIMDDRQHCTYMNPAAEALTGFSLGEVQDRPLHDFIHHTRPDGTPYPLEECPIDRAFPQNMREQGEDVFIHKEGYLYAVAYTASPIREGNRTVGTIIEVRDITREKELERQRSELDRAKTAFFSNVSHELRTPLTLMLGPAETALANPAVQGADRANWELVHRNGLRLLRLVNTLLDFSRVEAGRLDPSYEPVDLAALTRELAGLFESPAQQAGLGLELRVPSTSEPAWVDAAMWERIVLNLLSNALKFTFEGCIEVRLEQSNACFALMVRDTGVGIVADELPLIFDRFHQARETRSRTYEGTGIGLSLVRELVELHGGTVEAESEPGRGSTFTVRIPRGRDHLPADRLVESRSALAISDAARATADEALAWTRSDAADLGAEAPSQAPSTAPRVLIADDNSDMRQHLRRVLCERYRVETACDGLEALEAARRQPPDLIVSDVMMPRMDGVELMSAIRRDPQLRLVPVILLSARAGEEAATEGLGAGANDYVIKPFAARELLARVDAQLELARLCSMAQRETAAALQAAQEASHAKDEFLAMLGHELRNPLAPITTALQLMRLRGDEGSDKERAVIERQVRHLSALVDDLLDVSRVVRGKIGLQKQEVSVAEVVARGVELASPLIDQKRQTLSVEVDRADVMQADPVRLAQVVSNLLTNAAKYTPSGGRIRVWSEREGAQISLHVRDDGIGIEPELLPQVFDLFTQGPRRLDRSEGGLGLGLALVKNLVELHGGRVEARSEGRGRGSELIVRLPVEPRRLQSRRPAPQRPTSPAPGGGLRILIVDDNEDAADLLAVALSRNGHQTRAAYDAVSALELSASFHPDVVLLDIGLPVMDGYEVAERLGAHHPDVLLVAVTGYGQAKDVARARQAGFAHHFVKPLDLQALQALLAPLAPRGQRTT